MKTLSLELMVIDCGPVSRRTRGQAFQQFYEVGQPPFFNTVEFP
jgi:hypothetical protein